MFANKAEQLGRHFKRKKSTCTKVSAVAPGSSLIIFDERGGLVMDGPRCSSCLSLVTGYERHEATGYRGNVPSF